MSMTAAELFEVVKDVPREAWGELDWVDRRWVDAESESYITICRLVNEIIGSMTTFLIRERRSVEFVRCADGAFVVYDGKFSYVGKSLVAALAAACKEAA